MFSTNTGVHLVLSCPAPELWNESHFQQKSSSPGSGQNMHKFKHLLFDIVIVMSLNGNIPIFIYYNCIILQFTTLYYTVAVLFTVLYCGCSNYCTMLQLSTPYYTILQIFSPLYCTVRYYIILYVPCAICYAIAQLWSVLGGN